MDIQNLSAEFNPLLKQTTDQIKTKKNESEQKRPQDTLSLSDLSKKSNSVEEEISPLDDESLDFLESQLALIKERITKKSEFSVIAQNNFNNKVVLDLLSDI